MHTRNTHAFQISIYTYQNPNPLTLHHTGNTTTKIKVFVFT